MANPGPEAELHSESNNGTEHERLPVWKWAYGGLFTIFGATCSLGGAARLMTGQFSVLGIFDLIFGLFAIVSGQLLLRQHRWAKPFAVLTLLGFLASFAGEMIPDEGLTVINGIGIAIWAYAAYDMLFTRFRSSPLEANDKS